MCGIIGFLGAFHGEDSLPVLRNMVAKIAHRGPDAQGVWVSDSGDVALGHRRLSILDLSPSGAQPMATRDGRYVIVFNGEIYNYAELRNSLVSLGIEFRGSSDTEVLLNAIATWGVPTTLPRLNGMFAFAVWDRLSRRLWIARDRFGEKPLYYSWQNGALLFGSELKAFGPHPAFSREVDTDALSLFVRFNYVPAPYSIFKHVRKLPPGQYLCAVPGESPPEPAPYWSLTEATARSKRVNISAADPALVEMVDKNLSRSVKMRMVSDVPVGAFLSGGIDSSVIVALMQAQSSRPVKTFTIGFWEGAYNEADDAAKVARHLGTEHHELYLSSRECMDVIAGLPDMYDEPFADSSQIPTALVSQFTSKHVTVALSGDAGDEIWGGYNRYYWSMRIWPRIRRLPLALRHMFAALIQSMSPVAWDRFFNASNYLVPKRLRVRGGGEKLHKLSDALDALDSDQLYASFVSQWQRPGDVLVESREPRLLQNWFDSTPADLNFVERMMFLDSQTYLPDDILCKVDRASMASSLEARVPFLDNEHVELAWSLPLETRIHRGVGKWPLRQVLKRYLPESIFERPKLGFGIPIGSWLRGPLRPWAEEMLTESRIRRDGYFRVDVVRKQWEEHLSGRFNRQHSLWGVLMFQAWLTRKWN